MSILSIALFVFCTVSVLMFVLYFADTTFAQNRENIALQELDASIVESALELDGETNYVEIMDSDVLNTLNTQVTVSAWLTYYHYLKVGGS